MGKQGKGGLEQGQKGKGAWNKAKNLCIKRARRPGTRPEGQRGPGTRPRTSAERSKGQGGPGTRPEG